MTIRRLIQDLKSSAGNDVNEKDTCDGIKSGDENQEIKKVAISMFATPEVIRNASIWGANLLIVHEPVFYNHFERGKLRAAGPKKKKLLNECGMTVFRFHDYAHARNPDLIYSGQIDSLGLPGKRVCGKYYAVNRFLLDQPMTARELAKQIETSFGIAHVRIAGCLDREARDVSCCFGTPGHIADELQECSFVLAGEICEWSEGEMARDYAQLGQNKAILVLGHIGSEHAGMMLLKDLLKAKYPGMETEYFECGEVYRYTED